MDVGTEGNFRRPLDETAGVVLAFVAVDVGVGTVTGVSAMPDSGSCGCCFLNRTMSNTKCITICASWSRNKNPVVMFMMMSEAVSSGQLGSLSNPGSVQNTAQYTTALFRKMGNTMVNVR